MNKIQRIPFPIFWTTGLVILFTFVKHDWVTYEAGRFAFAACWLVFGGTLTAMNCDFKFWGYKK